MQKQPHSAPTPQTVQVIEVEADDFEAAILEIVQRANRFIDHEGQGFGSVQSTRTPGRARVAVEFTWTIQVKKTKLDTTK